MLHDVENSIKSTSSANSKTTRSLGIGGCGVTRTVEVELLFFAKRVASRCAIARRSVSMIVAQRGETHHFLKEVVVDDDDALLLGGGSLCP